MKQDTTIHKIAANDIRTTVIEGENFVAMEDFCKALEDSISSIVLLTKQHELRLAKLKMSLDSLTEAVAEQYPEVLEELERASNPDKWN